MPATLAEFRNPGSITRIEKGGDTVYKRVMLLSPGVWADAGSGQHVDYAPDGIRASAENFVDIDAVTAANPEWPDLSNAERVQRLRDLPDSATTDELPINFLHGEALHGAKSLEEIGHVPAESIIVDDDGRLYGDLTLHGDSPQSETAIELMDEVLESTTDPEADSPPVGPSVEIPADDVVVGDGGVATLQEAFFSGVAIVFNPASRPVELGVQATQRAVAMTAASTGDGAGTLYRGAGSGASGQTLKALLRHRWRMADTQNGGPPNFDELSDDDLKRALETMREDMTELEAALQGPDEFGVVAEAVDAFFAAEGEPGQGADEFLAWAAANTEIDEALLNGVLEAFAEGAGVDDLSEAPVETLQSWLAEQAEGEGGGEGEGEGEGNDGGESELTVEDLEAVKSVVGEVSEHLGDIKDLLTAREEDREEAFGDLERRLSDIEDEPVIKSLTEGDDGEFYTGEEGDGGAVEHEDVLL